MRLHMNIVYVHGLDSDANSTKGLLLEEYCKKYYPEITVHRPDLNQSPEQVFRYLTGLVTESSSNDKTVLIGSSLGGYFSTLVSNHTGCPALLLNPSTQPHITLQRFSHDRNEPKLNAADNDLDTSKTLYVTVGGWAMTQTDLQWFADHQLSSINHPDQVAALIKQGDELLDSNISVKFYQKQGATVILQESGDHRFSDFAEHLPKVIEIIQPFLK